MEHGVKRDGRDEVGGQKAEVGGQIEQAADGWQEAASRIVNLSNGEIVLNGLSGKLML